MLYRLIAQSGNTFYTALYENDSITYFRSPLGTETLEHVFRGTYVNRNESQVESAKKFITNTRATNHILIPADLTYPQFLDQYPEWNI